ncbi:helix-turn-helix domain-containing protein [Actinoallomurus purpureus]|uniref:XRE family transcriptional regulator n=1 Tax=Actinoallomurus purpureus TaxID=478114 RepID=UPI002092709C|nr:XRE family transcriptional regulator [Actinoallomurus purpureus]MCO6010908.1 helix-turn-helix domain-containing protein [Actinoallomurus purpureus]
MNRQWEDVKREAARIRKEQGREFTDEMRTAIRQQMLDEIHAYQLAEIRRRQSRTQREVAAAMGVSAPRVSAIEHGDMNKVEVATLRSYVEALGGRLRIIADFGEESCIVT